MASNKDLFIAALICVASSTIISMLIQPIWITASHVLLIVLMVIVYRVYFTSSNTFKVVDWFYSTTFRAFLIKARDAQGNSKMIISQKPIHIGSFIALLLVMFLSSCSSDEQKPANTSFRMYRSYNLDTRTIKPVYVLLDEDVYAIGDTVLVSNNGRLSNGHSAPKAVLLSNYGIVTVDINEY
jgi:hypothetical protein